MRCTTSHHNWERENVYRLMSMDSTSSQTQKEKKDPRVSNNKTPVQQTPAAACRPDWGFNKTAVPPGSNTLLYRLASLFNLDGRYLPKPPATPCQILPCFFLVSLSLSLSIHILFLLVFPTVSLFRKKRTFPQRRSGRIDLQHREGKTKTKLEADWRNKKLTRSIITKCMDWKKIKCPP